MFAGSSYLSLSAAALYLLVALCSALAAQTASREAQPRSQARVWAVLAALFIALALLRFAGAEELVRGALRERLYAEGTYDLRRAFQRPLVAVVMAIFSVLAFWGAFRLAHFTGGRRALLVVIASACGAAMVFLFGVRLVSLHAVDALLYGPFKLNWIIDIGASLTVLACALHFRQRVTGKAR